MIIFAAAKTHLNHLQVAVTIVVGLDQAVVRLRRTLSSVDLLDQALELIVAIAAAVITELAAVADAALAVLIVAAVDTIAVIAVHVHHAVISQIAATRLAKADRAEVAMRIANLIAHIAHRLDRHTAAALTKAQAPMTWSPISHSM